MIFLLILIFLVFFAIIFICVYKIVLYQYQVLQVQKREMEKYHQLFLLAVEWVNVEIDGRSIANRIKEYGCHNIAIYGMNHLGNSLVKRLEGDSEINVVYGIDLRGRAMYRDIPVKCPDEELEPVDAVVVTAVAYIDEVTNVLKKKLDCTVISLEDIVHSTFC